MKHSIALIAAAAAALTLTACERRDDTTVGQIMTESTLTQMYGIPVDVDEMHGHRIVVARREAPNGSSPGAVDVDAADAVAIRGAARA